MFEKHKTGKDGHRNICRLCMNKQRNKYYRDKYRSDPGYRAEYLSKKYKYHKERKINHSQPQTDKRRAYDRVKYALKTGGLLRPKMCELCGIEHNKLHGHHVDYTKALNVIFLCPPCHRATHFYDKRG